MQTHSVVAGCVLLVLLAIIDSDTAAAYTRSSPHAHYLHQQQQQQHAHVYPASIQHDQFADEGVDPAGLDWRVLDDSGTEIEQQRSELEFDGQSGSTASARAHDQLGADYDQQEVMFAQHVHEQNTSRAPAQTAAAAAAQYVFSFSDEQRAYAYHDQPNQNHVHAHGRRFADQSPYDLNSQARARTAPLYEHALGSQNDEEHVQSSHVDNARASHATEQLHGHQQQVRYQTAARADNSNSYTHSGTEFVDEYTTDTTTDSMGTDDHHSRSSTSGAEHVLYVFTRAENESNPQLLYRQPPYTGEHVQPYPGLEHRMSYQPDCGVHSYAGAAARLSGKVAIITGGDSGIGRATAVAFCKEQAKAVVIGHLPAEQVDGEHTCATVRALGCQCAQVPCDLADERCSERLVAEAVNALGRVDILVNNAAFQGKAVSDGVLGLSHERVARAFAVNIIAMFDLARLAIPHMPKGGSIINVASIQAVNPSVQILDYAATKGAIVTFTKGLSEQTSKLGIRTNCVAPGPVWTPLPVQSFSEDKIAKFGATNPTRRPAQPVEVAHVLVFLASQAASYVNGAVLDVNGGEGLQYYSFDK